MKSLHASETKVHLIDELVQEKEIRPDLTAQIEKGETVKRKKLSGSILLIGIIAIVLILGFFSIRIYLNQKKRNYARYELIPQIQKMVDDNFTPPTQAFDLAIEAEKYIPDDSASDQFMAKNFRYKFITISTGRC